MVDTSPPESGQPAKRTGLHKYFHVSRADKLVSWILAFFFFIVLILKLFVLDVSWISWADALEIALLWTIAGVVLDMYYRTYEEHYDK